MYSWSLLCNVLRVRTYVREGETGGHNGISCLRKEERAYLLCSMYIACTVLNTLLYPVEPGAQIEMFYDPTKARGQQRKKKITFLLNIPSYIQYCTKTYSTIKTKKKHKCKFKLRFMLSCLYTTRSQVLRSVLTVHASTVLNILCLLFSSPPSLPPLTNLSFTM